MPCGWGVKAAMVRVWMARKTVWSPCYTRAISERFRAYNEVSAIEIRFLYFTFTLCEVFRTGCSLQIIIFKHEITERERKVLYHNLTRKYSFCNLPYALFHWLITRTRRWRWWEVWSPGAPAVFHYLRLLERLLYKQIHMIKCNRASHENANKSSDETSDEPDIRFRFWIRPKYWTTSDILLSVYRH